MPRSTNVCRRTVRQNLQRATCCGAAVRESAGAEVSAEVIFFQLPVLVDTGGGDVMRLRPGYPRPSIASGRMPAVNPVTAAWKRTKCWVGDCRNGRGCRRGGRGSFLGGPDCARWRHRSCGVIVFGE